MHVSCVYPGLIETGMFTGVKHRFPWITPSLKTEYVAKKIADAIHRNYSQDIKMPFYVNFVGILRLLPIPLADLIRNVLMMLSFISF